MVKDDVSPEASPRFNGAKSYMYDFIPFEASFTIKCSRRNTSDETSLRKIREIKIT